MYDYNRQVTMWQPKGSWAQTARAVEYTDCISANECSCYDTKQSDGKVPVMLALWRMQSSPSLPSLQGPLWLRVVVPDRVLSTVQVELLNIKTVCKQMTKAKLNRLK